MALKGHVSAQMPETRPGRGHEASDKVYHTVTACCRCRQRKTRCDPGLPRCEPCERSNARCEYFDSAKNRMISRSYITSLQANVKRLQAELASLERDEKPNPDAESMVRGAGLIKFHENDEYRFMGPSSGITITRLVMDLAKQNTANKSIKDIVPDTTAREIKKKFDDESAKPTSKVYPLISSVAAPSLPSNDLMERLIDIYMVKAQYMLPLLHEPSFRQEIQAVYLGSKDPTLNFQLRLVIAISMQKLDTQYAGLADSYYLAALPYLQVAVQKMDLTTLQCLALIGQYSLLTPTRTASYWVIGLAAKLCHDLGLCEERTITEYPPGNRFNPLEIDMRRRLFWIICSMEYGLSHSLGRPSALGVSVEHIDVQIFELCDDRFITPSGLLPGHHPIMKKCIAIHFLKMRLLQTEIRRMLYLKKRPNPVSDEDPWFGYMQQKIDDWVKDCPKNDEGSGLSQAWFDGRRNTMIVLLYRPSPQIPEPSLSAAEKCYDAAASFANFQKQGVKSKMVDITWIFTQACFMSLNTILWSLSYPSIRQQHSRDEVSIHLKNALDTIEYAAERWPGVKSAIQLYENLIQGCLRAYDNDLSYVVHSPSAKHSPASPPDSAASPPSQSASYEYSPASTATASLPLSNSPPPYGESYSSPSMASRLLSSPGENSFGYSIEPVSRHGSYPAQVVPDTPVQVQPNLEDGFPFSVQTNGLVPHRLSTETLTEHLNNYGVPEFNPNSADNAFPSTIPGLQHWDPSMTSGTVGPSYLAQADIEMSHKPWLASIGDEYSRYMQNTYYPHSHAMQPLSQQQQSELMATLERDQLPDVSNLVSESATFYTAHLV